MDRQLKLCFVHRVVSCVTCVLRRRDSIRLLTYAFENASDMDAYTNSFRKVGIGMGRCFNIMVSCGCTNEAVN